MNPILAYANRVGITRLPWLRQIALSLLGRFGQHDTMVAHHWVPGKRVRLHRFRHKGYWFYGRSREKDIMRLIGELVRPGQTVIELGAHIGYVSLYLADLVGPSGHLYVFEPSPDNLAYTRANLAGEPAVTLIEEAASDKEGVATFFVEKLTGQNSTLVENYAVFETNRALAYSAEAYQKIEVRTTTVDAFVASNDLRPDFLKIDVEGAELACLRGSIETLKRFRPKLMVEVTEHQEAVAALMSGLGYCTYDSSLQPIDLGHAAKETNFFFIHSKDAAAGEVVSQRS